MTGAMFALLAAAAAKSTSSSGTTFIVFLVLIAVVGYFLLIRPQKQKQRRQREQQSAISVGDDVVTVGGIVGTVTALDADRVTIVSGGDTVGFPAVGSEPTRLVLVRNAISRKIDPPVPDMTSDGLDESTDAEDDEDGATNDGAQTFDGHLNGHAGTLGNGSAEGAESESEGTSS